MARWSEKLGNSVNFALEKVPEDTFLDNFFTKRAYIPETEEEKREFEDFSFVSSAMALAIYVSAADDDINNLEKERILAEILFQIEQHHYEYEALSDQFGTTDKEIVNSLFENYKSEILSGAFDIEKVIYMINKVYDLNPYKKNYLLRLSYLVAFTESKDIDTEVKRVDQLAGMMKVEKEEQERIRTQVRTEVEKLK